MVVWPRVNCLLFLLSFLLQPKIGSDTFGRAVASDTRGLELDPANSNFSLKHLFTVNFI